MEEQGGFKRVRRPEGQKRKLINRVKRIEGQLRGIEKMLLEDRYCDDILTQIAAAQESIKSLGLALLGTHIQTCVAGELERGNSEIIDELTKTVKRLCR